MLTRSCSSLSSGAPSQLADPFRRRSPPLCALPPRRQFAATPLTHAILAFEYQGGWRDVKGSVAMTVLQYLLGGGGSFSAGAAGLLWGRHGQPLQALVGSAGAGSRPSRSSLGPCLFLPGCLPSPNPPPNPLLLPAAGGPGKGMHSRLYTRVLNQHAWMHNCTALNSIYNDTGLVGVFASAESGQAADMIDVMAKEMLVRVWADG